MSELDVANSVTTEELSGVPVIKVVGEVDGDSVAPIEDAITVQLGRSPQTLVIDLNAVTFFGSAGIALLVDAHQQAARQNTAFVVVAAHRVVLRPLHVTGVDRVITVQSALSEALHV